MTLDLERFWAVVRSKKGKAKVGRRKAKGPTEIWVEVIDRMSGAPCFPRIKVQLIPDNNGYKCEVRYPISTEAEVSEVRIYATYRSESISVPCETRHLLAGDTLTLTIYISDGPILTRLKQLGLKPSV